MNLRTTRARALCAAASTLAIIVAGASNANAQMVTLDAITITATKTAEAVSDALASSSVITSEQIEQTRATSAAELFRATPGVWFQNRPDDPSLSINIRGMQDFGRVATLIDGARQNMQRTGHSADGQMYIEPNTIASIDITRGPTATIYGSGAIGGVVYFRTKDAEDILKPGEKWAVESLGELSTNKGWNTYLQGAVRAGDNIDLFFGGTYRDQSDYKSGNGTTVPNSGYDVWTGTAKATLRPAEGHTLKFGYTQYQSDFTTGQPGSSIYGTGVVNQIATARWLYAKPDDNIFNWDANVYWTRTETDQTKLAGSLPPIGIGIIGARRNFNIETLGFDVNNTSRFESGAFRHTLTVGVDGFQDKVDTSGFGVVFTPSGERSVIGGFAQWKTNYSSWLEIIGALRYDHYSLDGTTATLGNVSLTDGRLSPKITVGITPFKGFQPYVTYAEGFRAPAVTETLVQGIHPVMFAPFDFLPNPALKPEVGKTKEAGINLKYDNVFRPGDGFRAKASIYRNDVDDFIEFVEIPGDPGGFPGAPPAGVGQGGFPCNNAASMFGPGFCQQYQNIAHARLEGAEFEAKYDTGKWYIGVAGSHVRGKNVDTGAPLAKVPPDFITTTLGSRFLDNRLTAAVRWQAVAAKKASDIPDGAYAPTSSFNVVSLYLAYQLSENAVAALAVENLFNEEYSRYMQVFAGSGAPGTPATYAFPDPGITVKASLKVRFGGG
jgi:hemoglobin/transferrin/lactoferrin receptor protein